MAEPSTVEHHDDGRHEHATSQYFNAVGIWAENTDKSEEAENDWLDTDHLERLGRQLPAEDLISSIHQSPWYIGDSAVQTRFEWMTGDPKPDQARLHALTLPSSTYKLRDIALTDVCHQEHRLNSCLRTHSDASRSDDLRHSLNTLSGSSNNKIASKSASCADCERPFKNNSDARKHRDQHTRPYRCKEPDCTEIEGFGTRNDLERHKKSVHGIRPAVGSTAIYHCKGLDCDGKGKVWPRLDNFKTHCERRHPGEDLQELIQQSKCSMSQEGCTPAETSANPAKRSGYFSIAPVAIPGTNGTKAVTPCSLESDPSTSAALKHPLGPHLISISANYFEHTLSQGDVPGVVTAGPSGHGSGHETGTRSSAQTAGAGNVNASLSGPTSHGNRASSSKRKASDDGDRERRQDNDKKPRSPSTSSDDHTSLPCLYKYGYHPDANVGIHCRKRWKYVSELDRHNKTHQLAFCKECFTAFVGPTFEKELDDHAGFGLCLGRRCIFSECENNGLLKRHFSRPCRHKKFSQTEIWQQCFRTVNPGILPVPDPASFVESVSGSSLMPPPSRTSWTSTPLQMTTTESSVSALSIHHPNDTAAQHTLAFSTPGPEATDPENVQQQVRNALNEQTNEVMVRPRQALAHTGGSRIEALERLVWDLFQVIRNCGHDHPEIVENGPIWNSIQAHVPQVITFSRPDVPPTPETSTLATRLHLHKSPHTPPSIHASTAMTLFRCADGHDAVTAVAYRPTVTPSTGNTPPSVAVPGTIEGSCFEEFIDFDQDMAGFT